MDPLKAHAIALGIIEELTRTPEVSQLLKPLEQFKITRVWHFMCPNCGLHIWVSKRLSNMDCPDAVCACKWLPHTMDGAYERGVEERI